MQDLKTVNKISKETLPRKRYIMISRLKRRIFKHTWILRSFILAGAVLLIYALIVFSATLMGRWGLGYYIGLLSDFIFTPAEKVDVIGGRTNILILGKGGEGHEAPELTDTMIFVSFRHPINTDLFDKGKASVTLISLPRDVWLPDLRAKLNSAYYWGNKKKEGGGLILAKSVAEEIIGLPISYAIVIDFSGFQETIDVLGGVEVDVENSFTDTKYPISGRENDDCGGDPEYKCRYETIMFEKGKQAMDGETALKYVRSRNAEGDEGTDFARAARQQRVISAMKDKVSMREVLLSPENLRNLRDVFFKYTETDMDMSVVAVLARRVMQSKENIASKVLPEDLLINPPISGEYDNLYVFIPKEGDWTEVHNWVTCVLDASCE